MEAGFAGVAKKESRARARAHLSAVILACQHLLFGESSFLEQNRVTAARVQRCTATINEFLAFARMSLDELKLLANLDEMVVEMLEHMYIQGYGHGAGDHLMAAIKIVGWIQIFPDLSRAARALKGYRRYVSRPSPVRCGSSSDGVGNGNERRRVCGDARDPVCGLLEAQRIDAI